jgi:hypothetical protein
MTKNKTLLGALTLFAALSLTPHPPLHADELAVPVGSQADRSQADYPRAGMSTASVRARWGEPQSVRGPVGEPPISQWRYPGFTVYFERDRVIHTVLDRSH